MTVSKYITVILSQENILVVGTQRGFLPAHHSSKPPPLFFIFFDPLFLFIF